MGWVKLAQKIGKYLIWRLGIFEPEKQTERLTWKSVQKYSAAEKFSGSFFMHHVIKFRIDDIKT